jgi:hypothetical protein
LTEDEANELEEKIIDAMDLTNPENGYNLHSGGRHHKVTDATREKTRRALKGMFSGEKNPFYGRHHTEETLKKMKRPVQQYSMSGEYIKTFDGLTEAAKEFGLDPSQLAKTCKKDKLSCGGYQWKYADSDKEIKAYKRTSHNARRVIMCNMDGKPLRVFDSLSEAGKRFSKNAGKCIGQCCCGNQKTAYGYKWKYE